MKARYIIPFVIILIVVGFVAWRSIRPDATLDVVQPRIETIQAYVEEQATTELPHDYLIATPIAGWLAPIALREGDPVQQGHVLAQLQKSDLEGRVRQIQKQIDVLKVKIEKTSDHTLEDNALVEANATVEAINQTVAAAEQKLKASEEVAKHAKYEADELERIGEQGAAARRELRAAEAEWRKAEAEYRGDALELAALKTLAAVSYIGPKFIEDYKAQKTYDTRSYQKQLDEAEVELEIAKRKLARTDIASPITGVVLHRHHTRHQFLPAGTPLLTVGRLDDIEVIAEVLTERAAHINPEDRVDIYGEAIGDEPIEGEVTRVYPAGFKKISSLGVEQQRVNVAVKLVGPRPAQLKVGFRVHVRIYYDKAPDALTLPRTALFRSDEGDWQVMLVRDRITKLQTVEVGLMNDERAEIKAGLTAEDVVVAHPSREIVEDMRVETIVQN